MATTPADELKGFDTSKLETEDDDSGEFAFYSLLIYHLRTYKEIAAV